MVCSCVPMLYDIVKCLYMCTSISIHFKISASFSFQRRSILSFPIFLYHLVSPTSFLDSLTRFTFQFDAHFLRNAQHSQCSFTYKSFVSMCVSVHHLVMRQKEKFQNKWNACTIFSCRLFPFHSSLNVHLAYHREEMLFVQQKEIILANRIQFVSFSDNRFKNFTYINSYTNVRGSKKYGDSWKDPSDSFVRCDKRVWERKRKNKTKQRNKKSNNLTSQMCAHLFIKSWNLEFCA